MSAVALLARLNQQGISPRSLCLDSRRVQPDDVFLAWPGAATDGRRYIGDAVARGASAVLYEAAGWPQEDLPVPAIAVTNLSRLAGDLADLVYGSPSTALWMAGVTGTNGKTSVSQWVAQALDFLGRPCAVMGTLGNGFVNSLDDSLNTTPDAVAVQRNLAAYRASGAQACAMEVSSIGLDQGRVNGVHFDVAIFTNLTRDHLEYHPSMEEYGVAKARLFDVPGLEAAVLNLDDPFGRQLATQLRGRVRTVGYTLVGETGADEVVAALDLSYAEGGLGFDVAGRRVTTRMVGRFNASNLLAVFATLRLAGYSDEQVALAIAALQPPPGRMQRLGNAGQPLVVVDYAHTPDALENALVTLAEIARHRNGRLVCLFGCGGDRDPGKRPLMGEVAERRADQIIVTADNPRNEDAADIIAQICAGMEHAPQVIVDRAEAIAAAIAQATPNDVVLLAGKGHEPYQEVAGVRKPFSDIDEARRALELRK